MTVQFKTGGGVVRLVKGDLTQQDVDVIVNAANPQLKGGGGVDGAIHAAGGPEILEQTQQWVREHGELGTGRVMATTGGNLKATVIHTVGPVYKDGYHGENTALEHCHSRALKLAVKEGHRSIAFPAISTGAYGFPADEAAYVAVGTCIRELRESFEGKLDEILIVVRGDDAWETWERVFNEVAETMTGTPHMVTPG